jgi:hypothetical protein
MLYLPWLLGLWKLKQDCLSLAQGTKLTTAYVTVFDVLVKNEPATLASLTKGLLTLLRYWQSVFTKTLKSCSIYCTYLGSLGYGN